MRYSRTELPRVSFDNIFSESCKPPCPDLGAYLLSSGIDSCLVQSSCFGMTEDSFDMVSSKLPSRNGRGFSFTTILTAYRLTPWPKGIGSFLNRPIITIEVLTRQTDMDLVAEEILDSLGNDGLLLRPDPDRKYRAVSGEAVVIPLMLDKLLLDQHETSKPNADSAIPKNTLSAAQSKRDRKAEKLAKIFGA